MIDYISIPLEIETDGLRQVGWLRGDVEQSIDSILDLMVFTPRGGFKGDPEFGFEYWNHEFVNVNVREFNNSYLGLTGMSDKSINEVSRKECEASLKESILAYEPRLLDPEVRIELNVNEKSRVGRRLSKYEMRILISGSIDDGLGVARPYEKRISFMIEPTIKKIII